MDPVTHDMYLVWKTDPVTIKLMDMLEDDYEEMKEGLVYGSYDNDDEVKGRCRTIALILGLKYEHLFPQVSSDVVEEEEQDV